MLRIGLASIVQETNTFSPHPCTLDDFRSQSLHTGEDAVRLYRGTNTEFGGALGRLEARGTDIVPFIHAWSMSSGRLTAETLGALGEILERQLERAKPLDGLVLSLHGAMAAEGVDDADGVLLRAARSILGSEVVIGVCLDLHANVTAELLDNSDILIGYHTYPHVDQAETGGRIADLVVDRLEGRAQPVTAMAKRAMLLPPEAQGAEGPLGELRALADRVTSDDVLDVSLFPVQPWLDVDDLGFAVTVTANGDIEQARSLASQLVDLAWMMRRSFTVELVAPVEALERARRSTNRPILLSESADSPTAGATGDSPAMVGVLQDHGQDLRAYVTLVDTSGVATCFDAGEGAKVDLLVGCSYDDRFHQPVSLRGVVTRLGDRPFELTGPVYTGMEVSMGRWTVVTVGSLSVLFTERPACTFDPETFRHVGLAPELADVIVIRSANLFRAGWAGVAGDIHILDLPGASTPRLETLEFHRAPRPLYPMEDS